MAQIHANANADFKVTTKACALLYKQAIKAWEIVFEYFYNIKLGPVVQSIISLTTF